MTRQPAEKRPKGGVLAVISLLMIGSAAIRIGLEAGPALAKSGDPSEPQAMKSPGRSARRPGFADRTVCAAKQL